MLLLKKIEKYNTFFYFIDDLSYIYVFHLIIDFRTCQAQVEYSLQKIAQ